jgi:hypothetical protein
MAPASTSGNANLPTVREFAAPLVGVEGGTEENGPVVPASEEPHELRFHPFVDLVSMETIAH